MAVAATLAVEVAMAAETMEAAAAMAEVRFNFDVFCMCKQGVIL